MERKQLESAGRVYWNLQGLYSIPVGLLFVAAGLANLGFEPIAQTGVFAAAVVLAAVAAVAISRHYGRTYGRVDARWPRQGEAPAWQVAPAQP